MLFRIPNIGKPHHQKPTFAAPQTNCNMGSFDTLAALIIGGWFGKHTFRCNAYELERCGMGWMAPASIGVAMRHNAVVFNRV
jgi:hypothetical protein